MNPLRRHLTVFACVVLAAFSRPAAAASGDLDTSFNGTGKVTTAVGSRQNDSGRSVAMQSDGKIVVAGYSENNGFNYDFAVVRYNVDGSLDTSFNGAGLVTTPIGTSHEEGRSVGVQEDGKIVVAGFALLTGTYFAVVRYNSDGTLDTSFGGSGKVTTSFNNHEGRSLAIQGDGKIVVVGGTLNGSEFAVARYTSNGSLDATFSGDGKQTTTVGTQSGAYAEGVVVQSDGKIVVVGRSSTTPNSYDIAVVRYTANGNLDTTFNGTGKLATDIGTVIGGNDYGHGVAVQSDGKIIVVGESYNGSNFDIAVVRYNINGSLDTSFGTGGKLTTAIGTYDDVARSVVVQSDGKVVVAGETYSLSVNAYDFAVVRYNLNGSLDTTFNGTGKATVDFGANSNDKSYGATLQVDGKIVVAGAAASDARFAIARYVDDTTATPVLIAPATGTATRTGVSVSFSLPEIAQEGSVKLTFDDGATPRVLTLAASEASKGTHSFSFDPANPTATAQIASGAAISEGAYIVSISCQDALGNPVATSAVSNFAIDTTPPVLSLPSNITAEAAGASGAIVSFTATATDLLSTPNVVAVPASGSTFPLGTTTVNVTATDTAGNTQSGSFAVTVQDTTKPTLTLPSNITAEATSASGRVVTFSVSANDTVNGSLTPTVNPVSGSTFPLGTTTVNVSATDASGNTQAGSFSVTIQDTTKPTLSLPSNMTVEATGASGAVVSFSVSANDSVSGPLTPIANPSSGSTFALGATTVNVSATDGAGNTQTGSFTVTVRDTTAPVVNAHTDLTAEATSAAGAAVTYPPATAVDAVGVTSITYSKNSGTTFALGITTVTITARDAANNAGTRTFTVTVQDTTKPTLNLPANITAEATSAAGRAVTFSVSASDIVSGALTPSVNPASGSTFALGMTTVNVSATDGAGNVQTGSFTVTVRDTTKPTLNLPANIIAEATGPSGAAVSYSVSASDTVSGALTPSVSRASGSTFALGTTTVNVSATDGAGNVQTGSFTVTVQDTTKPALTLPADIIAEATGANGAVVSFNVSASDAVSGAVVPMVSPASGSTFALGMTTVEVSATDGAGNTQTGSFTVTVRDTTAPAILAGPVIAEATSGAGAVVNFTAASDAVSAPVIVAAPESGSLFPLGDTTVNVTATDAAMNVGMGSFVVRVRDTTLPALTVPGAIVAEATSASGAVVTFTPTATDAVSTPVVASVPGSGSTFPLGTTTVNVTATDAAGNGAQGSFSVTVEDTTAPTISVPFAQRTTSAVSVPDFTMKAVTSDIVGVTEVTQSPAPGGALAMGATVVTLTAHDAAGNTADASFTLTRYPPDPAHTVLYASGDPLPGAGTLGGGPEGAAFATFGVPAINDAGEVAFTAKWTSPLGPGAGMFAGNPVKLVAQVGALAPGLGGPTFKSMADPVLDAAGRIAFLATLAGAAKGEDSVLMTYAPGGPLAVVAREGGTVNGPGTPQIKAFGDVSLVDGEVLFTAKLKGGVPVARAVNDAAAFRITGGGMDPVVREGDAFGGSTVKAFKLLGLVGGSPGQSRGHTTAGKATFLVLLADGSQAIVDSTGGVLTKRVATGDAASGTTFKGFGVAAAEGTRSAFLATLNVGGAVTAANARGVFLGDGSAFEPVARVSDPVPDIANASFKAFLDPVLAPDAAAVAFAATLRGVSVRAGNDRAIFYQPEGGPLRAIAREGGQPPGTLAGAKWKSFVSLALPGGSTGPIFHATLARGGGVKATNDAGVWAVDSTGALRLLFREGETVDGKIVKSFAVLNAVRGSTGATRAFNDVAQVVWRANFVGGSSAIVVTSVP